MKNFWERKNLHRKELKYDEVSFDVNYACFENRDVPCLRNWEDRRVISSNIYIYIKSVLKETWFHRLFYWRIISETHVKWKKKDSLFWVLLLMCFWRICKTFEYFSWETEKLWVVFLCGIDHHPYGLVSVTLAKAKKPVETSRKKWGFYSRDVPFGNQRCSVRDHTN